MSDNEIGLDTLPKIPEDEDIKPEDTILIFDNGVVTLSNFKLVQAKRLIPKNLFFYQLNNNTPDASKNIEDGDNNYKNPIFNLDGKFYNLFKGIDVPSLPLLSDVDKALNKSGLSIKLTCQISGNIIRGSGSNIKDYELLGFRIVADKSGLRNVLTNRDDASGTNNFLHSLQRYHVPSGYSILPFNHTFIMFLNSDKLSGRKVNIQVKGFSGQTDSPSSIDYGGGKLYLNNYPYANNSDWNVYTSSYFSLEIMHLSYKQDTTEYANPETYLKNLK